MTVEVYHGPKRAKFPREYVTKENIYKRGSFSRNIYDQNCEHYVDKSMLDIFTCYCYLCLTLPCSLMRYDVVITTYTIVGVEAQTVEQERMVQEVVCVGEGRGGVDGVYFL